jgi:hypothetical protein
MDIVTATITCPVCGHAQREMVPTDRCLFFYQCDGSLENIFSFYVRYLEAVKTGKVPPR